MTHDSSHHEDFAPHTVMLRPLGGAAEESTQGTAFDPTTFLREPAMGERRCDAKKTRFFLC